MPTGATPKWQQLNLLNNSFFKTIRKELVSTRQNLNTITQILDTIQSAVSGVSALVSLIRVFETMLHRTIYAILDAVISLIREFIDTIKSTGVYVLDLTTYHFQPTPVTPSRTQNIPDRWWDSATLRNELLGTNEKNDDAKEFIKILERLNSFNRGEDPAIATIIDKIQRYLRGEQLAFSIIELIQLTSNIQDPTIRAKVSRLWKVFHYKKESYNEFIETICSSLLDPDDVADTTLIKRIFGTFSPSSNQHTGGNSPRAAIPRTSSEQARIEQTAIQVNWFDSLYKSGAPRFGRNSYMKTIIVGFSFDDFERFIELYNVVQSIFKNGVFTNAWTDFINVSGFPGLSGASLNDLPHAMADFLPGHNPDYTASRHEPNFVGLTLNQLAGDLFNITERMLQYLESLVLSDKLYIDTIADSIQFVVDKITKGIDGIKAVIQFIEDIIYLLESMLALSQLYMLVIDTQDGVTDTVYQIRNAEQFIPMKVKDREICSRFNLPYDVETAMFLNQDRSSQYGILDNIVNYKSYAETTISEKSSELQGEQTTLTNLQQKRTAYADIDEEIVAFETALAASTYSTDLSVFLAWILAQQVNIDLLESQYQTLLATDGNRAWLANQIATYTASQASYDALYTEEIAVVQAQIDALNPGMIDYATQLALLTSQKNALQAAKLAKHNYYDDLITRFTTTKNNVDAFLVFPINTYADLIPITNKINDLQGDIDDLVDAYDLYIVNYNATRAIKVGDISTKQGQIDANNSTIATKQNQIADKTAQLNYLLIVDPLNPLIPILQADIVQLNLDIANLQAANVILANDITTLYGDIATLDANKTTYENGKISDEEDLYREKNCYVAWKSSETKRLDKNVATTNFTSEYASRKSALETEVNNLISANIPSFTDPAYAAYVTELVQTQELKVTYEFVSYTIANAIVFPKIYIPESRCTKNMLIKLDGEIIDQSGIKRGGQLEQQQNKVNSLQSEVAYFSNQIMDMPSDSEMPAVVESTREYMDTSQYLDKTQKMYFGGFLISIGWPLDPTSNATDSLRNNFSEIVNNGVATIKQDAQGLASEVRNTDSISEAGNKINALIKKLGFK